MVEILTPTFSKTEPFSINAKVPPPLELPPAIHFFFLKKIFFLDLRYSILSN